MSDSNDDKEKMELAHAPQPGYRTAFYIVIAVSSLYLLYLFIT